MQKFAIYTDVIFERVVAGAERVDDDAVDLHAAFEDDLLGFATAGDAGLREDLLETVACGLVVCIGVWSGGGLRHGVSGFLTADLLIAVDTSL
jgi:hypothetical protein